MKSFLFVVVLLAGGGYFYFNGGKEILDRYINPTPLPETIEFEPATFIGAEYTNPHAR
jgi:hypothetical protein